MASEHGHTAIIVALVEEGGADINSKGGERGDTPLMLSVSLSCNPQHEALVHSILLAEATQAIVQLHDQLVGYL